MYHDDFIEENGKSKMRVVKVADTFDEFLNYCMISRYLLNKRAVIHVTTFLFNLIWK